MLQAAIRLAVVAALASSLALAAWADLPTPEQVGFHHCALIYERKTRSKADLLPYVSHVASGRPRAWLFDGFLFLHFTARSGVRTDDGPTTRSDWEYQLDQWFAPGRDLHALDEAVAEAARRLGKPPRPRLVVLTIPYPNPTVRDFGAGLDGASLDLQDQDGVRKAAEWYVGEAVRRFASAGFRHLKLWGIYWMREEMPLSDEPRVRTVADVVHQAGLKFAWIPWWRASGFDRWRVPGFDVAFLQPNYAFHAWTHGGSVRRNRLAAAADLAARHGLGIEMEAGDVVNSEADRLAFLHYLADGATGMLDYQRSAMAYYLGTETIERISTSNRPQDRMMYDCLARYIAGNRVPDPSPRLALKRTGDVLEARLSSRRRISALDILLDEPDRTAAWTGQVEVLVRKSRAESWRAGGWAIRSGHDETAGSRQVITVPIGQVASELRVVAHGQNRRPLMPARLVAETLERETPRSHAARGCAYVVSPRASGVYDDDGAKLTDGYVPERGFSEGRSVGWTSPSVAVSFDLGASRRFDRIEAVCQGGSYAAVNWPADAIAMISDDAPPPASLTGQGALPGGFRWIQGTGPAITRRRSATDMDGVIGFVLDAPVTARYVTLAFRPTGWLMLSEVRILDAGNNVARGAGVRYGLRPWPTPAPETAAQYADDGVRLTDGVIAQGLNRTQVFGWDREPERTVEVDLGKSVAVSSATVWTLAGGAAGVRAPSSITLECSDDGVHWKDLGAAVHGPVVEDGKTCEASPWTLRLSRPAALRYLRVRTRRSIGWAMLSEIEVHAADDQGKR